MGRVSIAKSRGMKEDPTEKYFKKRDLEETASLSQGQGVFARLTIVLVLLVTAIFYYWALFSGAEQMMKWFGAKSGKGNKYRKLILMIFYPVFCIRVFITLCVSNMRRKTIWTEFVTVYIIICGFLSFHAVYGAVKVTPVSYMDYVGIGIFVISNIGIGFYEHVQLKRASEFSYPLANLIVHHGVLTGWCFVSRAIFMFWWPIMVVAIFLLIVGHGSDNTVKCHGCNADIGGYAAKFNFCKVCREKAMAKHSSVLESLGVNAPVAKDRAGVSDTCAGCNVSISLDPSGKRPATGGYTVSGSTIDKNGQKWHPECFQCNQCQKPFLSNAYWEHEGSYYCESCIEDYCPTCRECGKKIHPKEQHVTAGPNQYHRGCFSCSKCKKKLDGLKWSEGANGLPSCDGCASS